MRRLSISPYAYEDLTVNVQDLLQKMLLSGHLRLNAQGLIENFKLSEKIGAAKGDAVLLEETEYLRVRQTVESFQGYGRADVEFVMRVLDAPEVPVKEA